MFTHFTRTNENSTSTVRRLRHSGSRRSSVLVLAVSLAALFLPVIYLELRSLHINGGILVYPLDDTFIHMQLARNLAEHHTWGMHPGNFASASSSLLYTVLLAITFAIFGVHTAIPLIINCIAGAALLIVASNWLRSRGLKPIGELIVLLLSVFLTPLPVLVISGMEHTLQCLFAFLFIYKFSDWLEKSSLNASRPSRLPLSVIVYGLLTTTIRYEGMFLIGIAGLVLMFHRKTREAVLLSIVSLMPLLVFGIYSMSKGGFILPNSVLVKSDNIPLNLSGIIHLAGNIMIEKWTFARAGIAPLATQKLLLLLPLAYLAFRKQLLVHRSYTYILQILFLCTLIHLAFAATGWFYRYEAYLIFNSVFMLGFLACRFGSNWMRERSPLQQIAVASVTILMVLPIFLRSGTAFSKARYASTNIFEQQYQMSRFCKTYYDRQVVAANDIGALSFFTEDEILDLWGLANNEVAKSRKKNYWTPAFLDSLTKRHHANLAIVYDSWFSDSLLKRWNKIGTWTIPNNVVCGDSTVSFYAVDPANRLLLQQNLKAFQPNLPAEIKVTYY